LILNGHLDVVSAGNAELWTRPPFDGTVHDGRLYGRGACDMKSGVTAAIFAIQALKLLERAPGGDVIIQSVSGEESGGVGTLTTIVKGYRADAAIILEPTRLRMCPIQSGALTFRLRVQGRSIHACMKRQGVSAIEKACYLIGRLNAFDRERHAAHSSRYYPDPLNVAPISVGTLEAGDWHSTVPQEAIMEGRCGVFAGESVEAAKRAFTEAVHAACDDDPWLREHPAAIEWFEGQFESGATDTGAPILRELAACHAAIAGEMPELQGVTYGSDLRLFTNHARVPAVLYGPGDVANAHTVDEYIDIAEIVKATKVLALTIDTWCE
jgi:acetylornithine deacetylase